MTDYHVGSGQTYADLAAVAAVLNSTSLSADARIKIHGTVTETSLALFQNITVNAFGVYLESASGEKFAGSPLREGVSGAEWVAGNTGGGSLAVNNTVGKFEILDLQIRKPSSANSGGCVSLGANAEATGHAIRRCLVLIEGQADYGVFIWGGTAENLLIVNTASYLQAGLRTDGNGSAINVGCIDLNPGGNSASSLGFYNTAGSGFPLNCKNCWSIGWDTDCSGSSAITGSNNATDKSSGSTNFPSSGRQVDLIGATELVDAAGSDYDANINATSVKLLGLGTATGAPSTDINGAAWNASLDIGPVKYASGGGGGSSIVPILNSYRQRRI